jgi:antitoxin FitA
MPRKRRGNHLPEAYVNFLSTPKTIKIRNVSDELHRKLKVRVARAGMTLSDYLLSEIVEIAAKPTLAEMMERLRS